MNERERLIAAIEALGANDEARGGVLNVTGRTVWNWRNEARGMQTTIKLLEAGVIQVAPVKRIEPVYSRRPVGRGKETKQFVSGFAGYYGNHRVCQTDGAGSKDECSRQLDSWVREELEG